MNWLRRWRRNERHGSVGSGPRGQARAAARAESDKAAFEQQEEELAARSEEIRRVLQSAGISTIPTQGTALSMPLHGELSSRFGMRTLFG